MLKLANEFRLSKKLLKESSQKFITYKINLKF
jgi:hypothetical protein